VSKTFSEAFASFASVAALTLMIPIAIGLLIGYPVKWLWNGLCPELFSLPPITFWQALGLYILTGILFRGSESTNKKD
jgi:hypothetical protein